MNEQQVQIFTSPDGQVELAVSLDADTVWLSQRQMAELFDKDVRTVNEHIKNIYREHELSEEPTIRKFRIVRQEGQRHVNRELDHYNLDVVISVGYRVKSKRGVQFRQWATHTLKQHLVEGYTLNQLRLKEKNIELEQVLALLSQTLSNQALVSEQGQAVVNVIHDYARSWSLLQGYDDQSLPERTQQQVNFQPLVLDTAVQAIGQLKQALIAKGEATELFGQLRGDGLASAIATIEQGFGDTLFYPNLASRAAHLLYFIVKNHPLTDGNKRTGAFLFLWYLRINQHLLAKPVKQLINDNALVAITLLIAESKPAQKDLMVRLIEHFVLLREDN